MNKRYIDIDSGFRDRKIWPNPAEFGIQLAQTGTKYGVTNAKNPITLAYPYYQWQWGCELTNGNQIPPTWKSMSPSVYPFENTSNITTLLEISFHKFLEISVKSRLTPNHKRQRLSETLISEVQN